MSDVHAVPPGTMAMLDRLLASVRNDHENFVKVMGLMQKLLRDPSLAASLFIFQSHKQFVEMEPDLLESPTVQRLIALYGVALGQIIDLREQVKSHA